jgi:cytochrome c peroxidase
VARRHAGRPLPGRRRGGAEEERTGLWIYESKGGCWRCHSGPNFTDEEFHNTGVGAVDGVPEPGREAITKSASDRGAFKTPTLRGIALSPPYMHDGSLATLKDVVEYYRRGGNANEHLDEDLAPLDLTDVEAARLVAFLEALSRRAPVAAQGAKR